MRDLILAEIRRLANAAGGKPPGKKAFANATGINESKWSGLIWARWGDALAEAGYEPNVLQAALPEGDILLPIASLARDLGRLPTRAEIKLQRTRTPNLPSPGAVARRYPTNQHLAEALLALSTLDEWADLAVIISAPAFKPVVVNTAKEDALVYLLQSGAHYKIGRSNQLERRVKEIRVALPEAVTLVHSIKTDDAPGIEAYWHRRFADRRANGEWFALTPEDVRAFCRRSFQ